VPPQRRKTGPSGPPRRRPKVAGTSRPPRMTPAEDERPTRAEDERPTRTEDERPTRAEDERPTRAEQNPAEETSAEQSRPSEVTLDKQDEKQEKPAPAAGDGTPAEHPTESPAEPVDPPEPPAGDAGRSRASGGWRPVIVVGAVAVVLAVIAAVAAFRPGAEVSNVAWVDTAETREVTEAAKVAIETMHGYDYRTIDEDFGRIRELLTPERLEEFDSTADVTKKAAIDTRTVTEVMVEHIGATMLDDTRAEVAAYINVSATGDGIAQGSAAAPLLVRMEKSDGRWLVSEIRDR
jgi:Mce-associated membrane protein